MAYPGRHRSVERGPQTEEGRRVNEGIGWRARSAGTASPRWDLISDSPSELLAELHNARQALRHGLFLEAESCAARLLGHLEGDRIRRWLTSPAMVDEVRAAGYLVGGLAGFSAGRVETGETLLNLGIETMEGVLRHNVRVDPAAIEDYGRALLHVGQHEAAAETVTRELAAGATMDSAFVRDLADVLQSRGRADLASSLLRTAQARDPEDADLARSLALVLDGTDDAATAAEAHVFAGMLLANKARFEEALDHLARAIRLAPRQAEPRFARCFVLLAQNRIADACEATRRLLDDYPELPGAHALRAIAVARAEEPEEARVVVEAALRQFGPEPMLLDAQARVAMALGDVDRAVGSLDRLLAQHPGDVTWLALKAQLLLERGPATEDTVAIGRKLVTLEPSSVDYRLMLVQALVALGQKGSALEELDSALTVHPNDPRLLGERAILLSQENQHALAVAAGKAALARDPWLLGVAAHVAASLLALDELEGALVYANDALSGSPDMTLARRTRGLVLCKREKYADAAADLRMLAERDLADSEVRESLSKCLVELGKTALKGGARDRHSLDETRQQLKQAADLDPENAWAHLYLGETLRRLGDYPAARECLDKAVAAAPDEALVVGTRGQVLRALGDPSAIEDLRRALQLDDGLAWVHGELGEALRVAGHIREARMELERAVELRDDDAWIWASKGAAELADSAWDAAAASLEKALSIQSDYLWAIAVRGSLRYRLDDLQGALDDVERAVQDPNLTWHLGTLGLILLDLERDPTEAERAFRTALERGAAANGVHIGLGEALMRQGRPDDARRQFELVVSSEVSSDSPAIAWSERGWSLLRLGRCEEAVEAMGEALARDEKQVSHAFDLALALLCAGRGELAVEEYSDAIARLRTIRHTGRRSSLIRMAKRDIKYVTPQFGVAAAPETAEILRQLDATPTSSSKREKVDD